MLGGLTSVWGEPPPPTPGLPAPLRCLEQECTAGPVTKCDHWASRRGHCLSADSIWDRAEGVSPKAWDGEVGSSCQRQQPLRPGPLSCGSHCSVCPCVDPGPRAPRTAAGGWTWEKPACTRGPTGAGRGPGPPWRDTPLTAKLGSEVVGPRSRRALPDFRAHRRQNVCCGDNGWAWAITTDSPPPPSLCRLQGHLLGGHTRRGTEAKAAQQRGQRPA